MQASHDESGIRKRNPIQSWLAWGAGIGLVGQVCAILWMRDSSVADLLADAPQMLGGIHGTGCAAALIFRWIMAHPFHPEPALEPFFPVRGRWLKIGFALAVAALVALVFECFIVFGTISVVWMWF